MSYIGMRSCELLFAIPRGRRKTSDVPQENSAKEALRTEGHTRLPFKKKNSMQLSLFEFRPEEILSSGRSSEARARVQAVVVPTPQTRTRKKQNTTEASTQSTSTHGSSTLGTSPQRRSDPFLYQLWTELWTQYFPDRPDISDYQLVWSSRPQKRTLASCNIHKLRVRVARELNHPQHEKWLRPLLYHEMCHAILGKDIIKENRRIAWHGKEFRALERRHPEIEAFDAWVHNGGWLKAVRSDRSKRSWSIRKGEIRKGRQTRKA